MKNTQILILVLVFVACGVCGYFLGGLVLEGTDNEPVPVVEEALPVLSTIPVFEAPETIQPVKNGKTYNLKVTTSVESGDPVAYVLYEDIDCKKEVGRNDNGEFTGISGVQGGTYYVKAQNKNTTEWTEAVAISGFDIIRDPVKKITVEELEAMLNINREASSEITSRAYSKLNIVSNVEFRAPNWSLRTILCVIKSAVICAQIRMIMRKYQIPNMIRMAGLLDFK